MTALEARLSAEALSRLMDTVGAGATAALQAAFPPQLRKLSLRVCEAHSPAMCQLLLDALAAMERLEKLDLVPAFDELPDDSGPLLSLEPLLQLPYLTHFEWRLGNPTVPQLLTIKQIGTLRVFHPGAFDLTVEQLSALCRPPHRLQQLEEVELWRTIVNGAAMAELACLPTLTSLQPRELTVDAFAFLPHFPHLQRLSVDLGDDGVGAAQQEERNALLVSALAACPALTNLSLTSDDYNVDESFGDLLVQAVPRLHALIVQFCSLPSLRFLLHAPQLESLALHYCKNVRPGHVFGLGSFAPRLQSLYLYHCAGLHLDKAELQLLTPPGAMGLPHLRAFRY